MVKENTYRNRTDINHLRSWSVGEGDEDLYNSDCRIWSEAAEAEKRMCTEESASEMSVWIWIVLFVNILCVCMCVQYFCYGSYLVLVILINWSDYLIAWRV
jgi:hypothetical protein